jgi:hypothetical protein
MAHVRVNGWVTAGLRAVNGGSGCTGGCCGLGGSEASDGQDYCGGVLHVDVCWGLFVNCLL